MVNAGVLLNPGMIARESREASSPAPRSVLSGEAAIIASAIADPQAFAPLYEYYVDSIFGYCVRRVGDPDGAADLTSQIFIKALSALPKYQAKANATSFRSWLFTIAHNLVIDSYRTTRQHRSMDTDDEPLVLPDPAPSPEDHAVNADLRMALLTAMESLTEQQRQIVDLRLAGLNGPEIAAVLDMHVAAVKSLQFRAYTRLRVLLRDRFDAEFGEGSQV